MEYTDKRMTLIHLITCEPNFGDCEKARRKADKTYSLKVRGITLATCITVKPGFHLVVTVTAKSSSTM